jgi:hypothetical protein
MKLLLILMLGLPCFMLAQQHQIGVKMFNKTLDANLMNKRFLNKYVYGIEYSYWFKKNNRIFIEANLANKTIQDISTTCADCYNGVVKYSNTNFHLGYIYNITNTAITPLVGFGMQIGGYNFEGQYSGGLSGGNIIVKETGQLIGANFILGLQARFLKNGYSTFTFLMGKQELINTGNKLFDASHTNTIIYQPLNISVGTRF